MLYIVFNSLLNNFWNLFSQDTIFVTMENNHQKIHCTIVNLRDQRGWINVLSTWNKVDLKVLKRNGSFLRKTSFKFAKHEFASSNIFIASDIETKLMIPYLRD